MVDLEPGTGTALVLHRLHQPYDPERITAALLGLTLRAARQCVSTVVATCDEAEDLLAAMPSIVRSLAIATTDRPERCMGELRGPVLWGETMSARSASAGDPGLFVCATTTKAYDTDENRVLKAALAAVERAGRRAEDGVHGATDDVVRRARHNGHVAARLLEHQTLAQVPVTRPSGRVLQRTRAGSRRATYRPALALLHRAATPLGPDHLTTASDAATRADHDLLAAALVHLDRVTGSEAPLRSDHGGLTAGPISYRHPHTAPQPGTVPGVTIDGAPVGSPDQIEPAIGRALRHR